MRAAYEAFEAKCDFLENQGYTVVVMWSCDWKERRNDPDAFDSVSSLNIKAPLSAKDAFRGGRTNAAKLFYECGPGEKIHHIDIVSLYPTVNKKEVYCVSHPEIIVSPTKDIREYFGIAKCVIEAPPTDLFPVLPMTVNGKLVFPLCKTCALNYTQELCTHDGEDRWLEGTWCTPEIHFALDNGYKVIKVHEVWHWEERRPQFFADFIDKFLKIKTEASGWPSKCVDGPSKLKYIDEVRAKEGIALNPDAMVPNPGLKAVSKLMLNSFWGKFGMRDNLCSTEFIQKPKRYFDLLRSSHKQIHDIHIINNDCVMVTSSPNDDFNEGNNSSNLAIASLTTSYARLRLLTMLRSLADRVLYFDTDSVIYVSREGDWEPERGSVLGEWDNQLEAGESHIVSFMSLGPKTYSYVTDTGRVEMKIKSITQNGYTEDIMAWNDNGDGLIRPGNALSKDSLEELLDDPAKTMQVPKDST